MTEATGSVGDADGLRLAGFRLLESGGGVRFAVHGAFQSVSGARHGFALRSSSGELPGLPEAQRAGLMEGWEAARLRQVHGDAVLLRGRLDRVDPDTLGPSPVPQGDAHTTREARIILVIQSADCVPLLVADPDSGAVGAAHAGWRGTVLGIATRLVERMSLDHGSEPSRLVAILGPAIGSCCYTVREDVAAMFRRRFPARRGFLTEPPDAAEAGGGRLDLVAANVSLLARAGLREECVFRSGLCTACRPDLFPSYRAQGSGAGRMYSLLAREGG